MKKLLVLNGPNINRLGKREADIYGHFTVEDLENELREFATPHGYDIDFFQSNHEGDLIDQLHKADEQYEGIIFNPAAYTHTSIALHDAIKTIQIPVIEVHISNIHQREPFRHVSMTASACQGQIVGFGLQSYLLAVMWFVNKSQN